MTVFEFDVGDRAAVETLRGTPCAGSVVGREMRLQDHRPVPTITVQVSENVTLERPQSDVTPP
jgi:hypothetical protein